MVKYYYDVDEEGFRREDRRGRILPINIVEARRIESLRNLGWGVDAIHKKMVYTQTVSKTTTRSFIKNLEAGNINLGGDYPAPTRQMENMDMEARLSRVEEKIDSLEKRTSLGCCCETDDDKSWKNLWGKL